MYTLLEGFSIQAAIEANKDLGGFVEEGIIDAYSSEVTLSSFSTKRPKGIHDNHHHFKQKSRTKKRCKTIDREYNELRQRNAWTYVPRPVKAKVIQITWVFRLKFIYKEGVKFLNKARCCVRGDQQKVDIYLYALHTYAPVASHESVRTLIAYASSHGMLVEGGNVANAFLYGDIECEFIIEQPANPIGLEEIPGYV